MNEIFSPGSFSLLAIIISGIVMVVGSITDLKKREVPDWVNYGLFFTAIAARLIYSIAGGGWQAFFEGLAGFLFGTALALLMFYTGQWGGGDSKMLIGLGTLIGIPVIPWSISVASSSIFISFLLNIMVVGALYGVVWSIALVLLNKESFIKKWNDQAQYMLRYFMIGYVMIVAGIVAGIIFQNFFIGLIGALPLLFMVMIMFTKSIEHGYMKKIIPVSELTEGEWIEKDVVVKGKYICGPKDLGISKEQIAKLKQLKIKEIAIKIGIPFIPSFLMAFIVTITWGNLITKLLALMIATL